MSESKYLSAEEEEGKLFAQANIAKDKTGKIVPEKLIARSEADYPVVDRKEVDFTDVAPNQIASISASLIPFLERSGNFFANSLLLPSQIGLVSGHTDK